MKKEMTVEGTGSLVTEKGYGDVNGREGLRLERGEVM